MPSVNPCLVFNGNAEESFHFYQSVFGGELMLSRFGEMEGSERVPDAVKTWIAYASLPLTAESALTGMDSPEPVETGNRAQMVNLVVDSAAEAERVFEALSTSGKVDIPLGKTQFAESFAMVTDKYSVPWLISFGMG
ncbi:VOC family protein [Nocardia sp. SYP-A9097]|uniref:VOC family protein n=1 Tax=Nocardia sp. SYP-A9097 TaxID=2663237 RepID=UPI00129A970B|nr:VOC family protein [Nocardia sp. SYP-A9097]MRH91137.1 VOC family protein [Nocardia sp. SYP-A9097]